MNITSPLSAVYQPSPLITSDGDAPDVSSARTSSIASPVSSLVPITLAVVLSVTGSAATTDAAASSTAIAIKSNNPFALM